MKVLVNYPRGGVIKQTPIRVIVRLNNPYEASRRYRSVRVLLSSTGGLSSLPWHFIDWDRAMTVLPAGTSWVASP